MADVPVHVSRWEVKPGETFRVRFSLYEPEKGTIRLTTTEVGQGIICHWIEARLWTYDEMLSLRKQAQKFHHETRSFYTDADVFDELKLKHLLVAWSFGELDPHLKLQHVNGVLTDESLTRVKKIYPWVLAHVLRKINDVLEGVGE